MKRYLCWLAVLGVAAVPDWASACWPGWGVRWYAPPPPPPIYAVPVCPPPIYVAPPIYAPYPVPVLPPPRLEPVPPMAVPAPAPARSSDGMGTAPAPTWSPGAKSLPTRPPAVEPVRPAGGGSDTPVSPAGGAPKSDTAPAAIPPDDGFPEVKIPKGLQLPPKQSAPLKEPDPAARPPARELPRDPDPQPAPTLPPLELPKEPAAAAPSPAPAPPESLTPSLPTIPDSKKPEGLPPLLLPPDGPPPPAKSDSTSRSSPLTGGKGEVAVNVFTAAGPEPIRGGYRTVGFYNHTDRDLALTIEGQAVKLPAKTYLHAKLGPTFTWALGDRPAARQTVPTGAAGLDVVFRD
jgi:hypothetical protein